MAKTLCRPRSCEAWPGTPGQDSVVDPPRQDWPQPLQHSRTTVEHPWCFVLHHRHNLTDQKLGDGIQDLLQSAPPISRLARNTWSDSAVTTIRFPSL